MSDNEPEELCLCGHGLWTDHIYWETHSEARLECDFCAEDGLICPLPPGFDTPAAASQ